MSQITRILNDIKSGHRSAEKKLLPLVYDELRRLAAAKMARERRSHHFQATELVHEAYLRLIGPDQKLEFNNRRHFFTAAAEAMRRILVDEARRRHSLKRGGDRACEPLDPELLSAPPAPRDDLLALDEALNKLAAEDAPKAELVKLRFFAALTLGQAAEALGISINTADRWWAYAKAYLYHEMTRGA
jgi:RNA polymerase sigma factor (TIGR02999 family)